MNKEKVKKALSELFDAVLEENEIAEKEKSKTLKEQKAKKQLLKANEQVER